MRPAPDHPQSRAVSRTDQRPGSGILRSQPNVPRHMWVAAEVGVRVAAARAAGSHVGSHMRWLGRTAVDARGIETIQDHDVWTGMVTAWRSRDQEVGCSSRPGRAGEPW
jgi:hypothetical protein